MSSPTPSDVPAQGHDAQTFRGLRFAALANRASVWEWRVAEQRVLHVKFTESAPTGDTGDEHGRSSQPLDHWLAQIHSADRGAVQASLERFVSERAEHLRLQYRMRLGNELRWFEVVGVVGFRRVTGEVVQVLGTETDVTESKRVLLLLSEAQMRAEQASRAKSEFLANMSHEVRTPLNAVMGLSRLLRKTPIDRKQTEYLDMIDSSAKALLGLLNDVLDLSKIEAGMLSLETVKFELRGWLEETVFPFSGPAQEKGLDLRLDIDPSAPAFVLGDPVRLRQIISNLVSNAVRFTERGGVIVSATCATGHPHDSPPRAKLTFSVVDTGIGIAEAARERIFEAFTQADASTTRRFGGTGLGLAICQRLARMHRSRIEVDSVVGRGSRFQFGVELEIPEDQSFADSQASDLYGIAFHGLKVLVAEDHPINQLLARQFLEQYNCQVVMANTGVEAVQAWQREPFDLILMDIQMPTMGGDEATRRIRSLAAKQGRRQVPIIAMTAHALAGDKERYLAVGMNGYVSKPMSPEALTQAVNEALLHPRTDYAMALDLQPITLDFAATTDSDAASLGA